jgi:hypothetical protein
MPVAVAALVSLGEASAIVPTRLRVPFYPASTVPSRAWPAERCPLCADGIPYTDPVTPPGRDNGLVVARRVRGDIVPSWDALVTTEVGMVSPAPWSRHAPG